MNWSGLIWFRYKQWYNTPSLLRTKNEHQCCYSVRTSTKSDIPDMDDNNNILFRNPRVWSSNMMTSSNGNIPHVTGSLWGESFSHRRIPLPKASSVARRCFLWCVQEQTAEQTVDILVIWDAMALIKTSLKWFVVSSDEFHGHPQLAYLFPGHFFIFYLIWAELSETYYTW